MRKVACVLLIVAMVLSTYAFADNSRDTSDFVDFEIPITSSFDFSTKEWYSSSLYRALLTILLSAELGTAEDAPDFDFAAFINNETYVGKNSTDLIILGNDGEHTLIIVFIPVLEEASYCLTAPVLPNLAAELLLNQTCEDGYSENDREDLSDALNAIKDVLNN